VSLIAKGLNNGGFYQQVRRLLPTSPSWRGSKRACRGNQSKKPVRPNPTQDYVDDVIRAYQRVLPGTRFGSLMPALQLYCAELVSPTKLHFSDEGLEIV
jgi:hypothetical protein